MLSEISDLDAQCDGVLIHSENFQALGLMQEKYKEQIKCIYIDPPYNTGGDGFSYKDSYQHSSWLSLISDRIELSRLMMKNDATFFSSIDHNELSTLKFLLENIFEPRNFEGLISWRRRHNQPNDKTKMIGMVSEYILSYAKSSDVFKKSGVGKLDLTGNFSNPDSDPLGDWASKPWKAGSDQNGSKYQIKTPAGNILNEEWMGDESTYNYLMSIGKIFFPKNGQGSPRKKYYKYEREEEGQSATNWWSHDQFGHNQGANDLLTSLFGYKNAFSNSKPIELLRSIFLIGNCKKQNILDFFSGSGTTAHAVINLNREDCEKRKYILVEQNNYFDTVLKPRIQKVVYSKDWKEGKPVSREGISHCFKYLRLESYEDVLNNLVFKQDSVRDQAIATNRELRRDYVLNYFLDVETQGSQSLLNIADFRDPTAYKMYIKKPGSESQTLQSIDLIETFNWLIGLWVQNMAAPQQFSAEFSREIDPDLPTDHNTRLLCTRLKQAFDTSATASDQGRGDKRQRIHHDGTDYWFRLIEGYTLKIAGDDNSKLPTLIVWRKLTDDPEKDNAVLQKYLMDKMQISPREQTYAVIYVNGSHTLPNPVIEGEQTKVRLIEEAFHAAMWSGA